MSGFIGRIARFIERLPGRLVRAVPWAHMEPTGLGAGRVHTEDLDELERQRRQAHESQRRNDQES